MWCFPSHWLPAPKLLGIKVRVLVIPDRAGPVSARTNGKDRVERRGGLIVLSLREEDESELAPKPHTRRLDFGDIRLTITADEFEDFTADASEIARSARLDTNDAAIEYIVRLRRR
jgi:hypothetical protein